MNYKQKLNYITDNHFELWIKTMNKVEDEISNMQSLYCVCGRLATGMHESHCQKFKNKIISETLKRLKHLLPKKL